MAIREKKRSSEKRVIDLTGPEGNAFCLMGIAKRTLNQLGKDSTKIIEEMMSGDYENLIRVFDRELGAYYDLER